MCFARPVRIAIAIAMTVLGAACGDDDAQPMPMVDAGPECTEDPRAETYTANMQKAGADGLLTFRLVSSDPAPPIKGTNEWVLEVEDASGAPVEGATITVTPYMPDHAHGTSIVPQISESGGGAYDVAPVYLFMGGLWEITVEADAGGTTDSAVFSFCIRS